MRQETILNYKNYKWMWIHLFVLSILLVIYVAHDPIGIPAGDTWLGYTYGVLAAAGMIALMWYAVRKRSYFASSTTLKGALAVHFWLGISLVFLVPLHSGFSFGFNVHTAAYIFLLLAVGTGIWGAVVYFTLAPDIGSHRGRGSLKELLEQLNIISNAADSLTLRKSAMFMELAHKLDFSFAPTILNCLSGQPISSLDKKSLANEVALLESNEQEDAVKFVGIVSRKVELSNLIRKEVKVLFWLKIWLYFHVPLACAAFTTMVIHIISVFYYW